MPCVNCPTDAPGDDSTQSGGAGFARSGQTPAAFSEYGFVQPCSISSRRFPPPQSMAKVSLSLWPFAFVFRRKTGGSVAQL